jgi:hypothetical protein
MDLKQLRMFRAIAELGSLSKAADRLRAAQPALSRHIKLFEHGFASGMVEHPFGTLKCCAGYRHFLVRGFDKVRSEWSLMALCYNFTRVLNILGFEEFVARIAAKAQALSVLGCALLRCIELVMPPFWTHITLQFKIRWLLPTPVA